MIIPLSEILAERHAAGAAAGAFTVYNAETAVAVLQTAAELDVPVIVLVSAAAARQSSARFFLPMMVGAAASSPAPVCIELDHVRDIGVAREALALGVGAVMADGSHLPYDMNVAFVDEVGRVARRYGAQIEAELGRVDGAEDFDDLRQPGVLTDPDRVHPFVAATGTHCLAVSIGNVHGVHSAPVVLDFDRIGAVRAATSVPLALHGASGLPDADIRRTVACGIRKVNFNTDIRTRLLLAMGEALPAAGESGNLLKLTTALVAAASEVVGAKLTLLANPESGGHHVHDT